MSEDLPKAHAAAWALEPDLEIVGDDVEVATPFLVLDHDKVVKTVAEFTTAFPGVDIHYAVKCNPAIELVRELHRVGCGFEIASISELALLESAGVAPGDVLFSNPVRPRSHIAEAHRRGVWRFCTDSRSELVKLSAAAPGAAVYVRLATRSAASLVPSEGKFGVDPSVAADLLERAHSLGLSPYGISFHVGSQMTDPHAWDQPISDAIHIAKQLADKGIRLEMLDIGGGFPARYGSDVPSLTEFGTHIACLLENLPYPMSVVAEPGRSLVAEAGVLVCKVIQVVRRAETWWVHTDLGVFNGMMEVLESNGQLRYPITSSSSGHMRTYHVTGPTCDSQDTFAFDVNLPASLSEGDLLFIHSAGAYTTAYSTRFNGFDEPTTVHHYSR